MNAKGSNKKAVRLLSLLLASSLFLGTQGFTVLAQTISQNGGAAVESKEQENDGKGDGSLIEPEDGNMGTEENAEKEDTDDSSVYQQDSGNLQQEVLLDGNVSGNNVPGGEGIPANPVHHCTKKDDGTDYTDFSYVYFGSYPQSEVTGTATKHAIDSAISQGMGQVAGMAESSEGIDVWIDGIRYRRISKRNTNYDGYFDNVPNNGYRYFKWERIKWRVLQNDGNTLFVVADKAIDCKDYNEEYTSITWENSTVRNWLNSSFYQTAFNRSEQGAIVIQNVVNEDNPVYGTEGGNNTSDNVYLLSISEVTNGTYGFCSNYSTDSVSRRMKTSDYANARGTWRSSSSAYEGNCCWWLRSPGDYGARAADVDTDGYVSRLGIYVNDNDGDTDDGICPALHINLSSGIWFMADDGTSGEGGTTGKEGSIKVTKLTIAAPSKKLAAGKKVKLTVDVTPINAANKAVTWNTSNKKYATIDQSGNLSLKKAGAGKTVTVAVAAKDGSGIKATYRIKIMKHAVKSIKLKVPSKTLKAGSSMTVKATVKTTGKSVNKTLKWQSSNTRYATVSKKGKVTAKKVGKGKTVTITATSIDGSNKKAKVKLKIK